MSGSDQPGGWLAANAALLGASFLWGSFYTVMADLLRSWDPLSLTAARIALGSAFLILAALAIEGRRAFAPGLPWGRLFLLGFFGFGVFCVLITFGIRQSDAISAALVSSTSPILAAFTAWALAGRRPRARTAWAAAIAVTGGVIVVFRHGPADVRGGEMLLLTASLLFVWYTLKVAEWTPHLSPLVVTTHTVAAGAVVLVPGIGLAAALGLYEPRVDVSAHSLALLAYLAATSVCLAVILWNYGTKRIRVEVASMYSNLCPVFTVLTSVAFGVYPTSAHLLGGMLILSAIVWAQWGRDASRPRLATHAVQGERHGG